MYKGPEVFNIPEFLSTASLSFGLFKPPVRPSTHNHTKSPGRNGKDISKKKTTKNANVREHEYRYNDVGGTKCNLDKARSKNVKGYMGAVSPTDIECENRFESGADGRTAKRRFGRKPSCKVRLPFRKKSGCIITAGFSF